MNHEQLIELMAEAMYDEYHAYAGRWTWKDAYAAEKRDFRRLAEVAIRTFREVEQSP